MPTHAWAGFVHSWHTLGIVLKWMCITVVGIPAAIATCLLIGVCALLFAALVLAAAAAGLVAVFYILKFAWWLLSSTPYWIRDWRIRRAERRMLIRFPTLPTREIRHISGPIGIPPWQPLGGTDLDRAMAAAGLMPDDAISIASARSAPELRPPPPVHTCTGHRPPTPAAGPVTPLPPLTSAECHVCFEEKDVSEYPARSPTDQCHHLPTACCSDCLTQSITASFEGNMWDDIRCPICNFQLQHKDVAEFATPEIFQRYDIISIRRTLEREVPNFRWCLNPTCESGEEYEPLAASPVACSSCQFLTCSVHHVAWHESETCEEYDKKMNKGMSKEEKKTEKIIKKIAKRCPGCRRFINKNGGCPHMTCICGRQFCWNCNHDYPGHSWGCTRRS